MAQSSVCSPHQASSALIGRDPIAAKRHVDARGRWLFRLARVDLLARRRRRSTGCRRLGHLFQKIACIAAGGMALGVAGLGFAVEACGPAAW